MKWSIAYEEIDRRNRMGQVTASADIQLFHWMRDSKVKAKRIISIQMKRKWIYVWYRVRRHAKAHSKRNR